MCCSNLHGEGVQTGMSVDVLQCAAVCRSVLQCVAICYTCVAVCCVLQYLTSRGGPAQYVFFCFSFSASGKFLWRTSSTLSTVLQCVAVCCSVLRYVAVCCSVLQCVAVCCSVLKCVAVCCSVLQCVAACCSVLQRVAEDFSMHKLVTSDCVAVCCSKLQCVPVCCSALQRVAADVLDEQTRHFQLCHSVLWCAAVCGSRRQKISLTRASSSISAVLYVSYICIFIIYMHIHHIYAYTCTANPTWSDIFECCFKAQSSKPERLFSLKRGKRDVGALSFELSKMTS